MAKPTSGTLLLKDDRRYSVLEPAKVSEQLGRLRAEGKIGDD
jgi:hypothetical protein